MAELIRAFEVAGRVLQAAQHAGQFVMSHVRVGGWGETASDIQPPHINVEHQLGDE